MKVSSKVVIKDRWPQYRNELGQAVRVSLHEAAGLGVGAARAKAPRPTSYKTGEIKSNTRIDVPVRGFGGWYIDITWTDFRARWFDRGTYQKLGRRLTKRSKEGVGGNRGVKPQRFMLAARRVGRLALIEALARRLK